MVAFEVPRSRSRDGVGGMRRELLLDARPGAYAVAGQKRLSMAGRESLDPVVAEVKCVSDRQVEKGGECEVSEGGNVEQ